MTLSELHAALDRVDDEISTATDSPARDALVAIHNALREAIGDRK